MTDKLFVRLHPYLTPLTYYPPVILTSHPNKRTVTTVPVFTVKVSIKTLTKKTSMQRAVAMLINHGITNRLHTCRRKQAIVIRNTSRTRISQEYRIELSCYSPPCVHCNREQPTQYPTTGADTHQHNAARLSAVNLH